MKSAKSKAHIRYRLADKTIVPGVTNLLLDLAKHIMV